jgi:hypothetical protein
LLQLRAPTSAAEFVKCQIVSHAVEPAAHCTPGVIEGTGMPPYAKEDFLQQLLSGVMITDDSQEQREDDTGMAIIKCPQRLNFANNQCSDQRHVRHVVVGQCVRRLGWLPTVGWWHDPELWHS